MNSITWRSFSVTGPATARVLRFSVWARSLQASLPETSTATVSSHLAVADFETNQVAVRLGSGTGEFAATKLIRDLRRDAHKLGEVLGKEELKPHQPIVRQDFDVPAGQGKGLSE